MESNTAPTFLSRIKSHGLASAFTILTTLTVGIVAGSVLTHGVGAAVLQSDGQSPKPLVIPPPVNLSNDFTKIVKQVGPAVVNINIESISKKAPTPRGRNRITPTPAPGGQDTPDPGDMQDLLKRFFGGQTPDGGDDDEGPAGSEREALGSGFIVDASGYIITNNHVIDKADRIFVKLAGEPDDGAGKMQGHPATLIGTDPETDIAVIKIDTKDLKEPLHVAKLGNSDGTQVGDWVLAIGSPFGLSETVSAGIISAKNRAINDRDEHGRTQQFQKFIQTDAAINPGNSGGPLVDMAGQVIGMNTAIYTQSMGSQGVGFAMPSNVLARIYNDLIGPTHKVIRGSIGITFQAQQSSAVTRMYGFQNSGVPVGQVVPGGGAAKAGLKPGDILITIDGRKIKNGDDLVDDISNRKVGSTVSIGYLREGKQNTATVTIGDRAQTRYDADNLDAKPEPDQPAPPDAGQTKLGLSVQPLPAAIKKADGTGGVIVKTVTPGSFADDIGLAPGDIISEINKIPVTDMASYNKIVSSVKSGDDVVFVIHIRNQQGTTFLGGTLR